MKSLFLVIFEIILVCFSLCSCTSPKVFWCTSNGIITYNKMTGQFEMLWEQAAQKSDAIHDTIYLDSSIVHKY